MQPCTPEETPIGTYMYNIYVAQRKLVDENFYTRYTVYFNPRVHDPAAPARFLAI